jgi:hypothetical protein
VAQDEEMGPAMFPETSIVSGAMELGGPKVQLRMILNRVTADYGQAGVTLRTRLAMLSFTPSGAICPPDTRSVVLLAAFIV